MNPAEKLIRESHGQVVEGEDAPVMNLVELQKDFDSKGLEDEITKRYGSTPKGLKIELASRKPHGTWEAFSVKISSDNLVDDIGIMKLVFKDVRVENFGGAIYNHDKEKGVYTTPKAWIPVHMSWEHLGGGTNGGDWFYAWYNFSTKAWTFR